MKRKTSPAAVAGTALTLRYCRFYRTQTQQRQRQTGWKVGVVGRATTVVSGRIMALDHGRMDVFSYDDFLPWTSRQLWQRQYPRHRLFSIPRFSTRWSSSSSGLALRHKKNGNDHDEDLHNSVSWDLLQKIQTALAEPVLGSQRSESAQSQAAVVRLRNMVGRFGRSYRKLRPIELQLEPVLCPRIQILRCLATEFNINPSRVRTAVRCIEERATDDGTSYARLRQSCTPAYEDLFRLMLLENVVEGLASVLEIRDDVLRWITFRASTTNKCEPRHEDKSAELLKQLQQLDFFLRQLLSTWMVPGLLQCRRLTYENSSSHILEHLVHGEAVHPMTSVVDLCRRFGPGRRVLALCHSCLPQGDIPLYVVYVFLSDELPTSMEQIHHRMDHNLSVMEEKEQPTVPPPTVATFYSISSLHSLGGLSGLGLGEYLIHSAVAHLQVTIPSIQTFVTLSPLPTFRSWLSERVAQNRCRFTSSSDSSSPLETDTGTAADEDGMTTRLPPLPRPSTAVLATIRSILCLPKEEETMDNDDDDDEGDDKLREILVDALNRLERGPAPQWAHRRCRSEAPVAATTAAPRTTVYTCGREDDVIEAATTKNKNNNPHQEVEEVVVEQLLEALRPWFMACAAHYLVHEKQLRSPSHHYTSSSPNDDDEKPLDRVARFHLGNGAILDRLHWKADHHSLRGWENSYGIMVTYRYDDKVAEKTTNDNASPPENSHATQVGKIRCGESIQQLLWRYSSC